MLDLIRHSDAAIVLAALSCLFGYVCGMGLIVCACWNRLRHPPNEHLIRLLRATCDERAQQVTTLSRDLDQARHDRREQARVIDAQTQQIVGLYQDVDRMTQRYVDSALEVRLRRNADEVAS